MAHWKGVGSAMHLRINVTLPEETVRLLDRVSPKGGRSRLIDRALRHFIQTTGRRRLRERLMKGYIRRSEQDAQAAEEWFTIDEEAWTKAEK
jgi:CopG family transcriptional regulator/antitoxin EndoAI